MVDDHCVPRQIPRRFVPFSLVYLLGLVASVGLLSAPLSAEIYETKTLPITLVAEIGTAGFDHAIACTVSRQITFSASSTWLNFDAETSSPKSNQQQMLKLTNAQALMNWHPLAGVFHLSAGSVFSTNLISLSRTPCVASNFDDSSYASAQLDSIMGDVVLAKTAVPYLGFGWARQPRGGSIGFFADFGILFTSSDLSSPKVAGPILADPPFLTNLHQEGKGGNRDQTLQRCVPLAQIGLLYQF